jgi:hypothetical protein
MPGLLLRLAAATLTMQRLALYPLDQSKEVRPTVPRCMLVLPVAKSREQGGG